MAIIVMCDDGIRFDGASLSSGPLAETAFVSSAGALAARFIDGETGFLRRDDADFAAAAFERLIP